MCLSTGLAMRTATDEPRARASWNLTASVRQGIDYGTWSSRWVTRTRTRPIAIKACRALMAAGAPNGAL